MDSQRNHDRAPARLFIVDDDALFRESLQRNLIDAGYDAVTFDGGPALLDHLAGNDCGDLILLDWKMPQMNGIEVLHRLREANCDRPVIFLTVLSDQIFEEAALMGGAVDFVEKSRSFTILLRRIELSLQGRLAAREAPAASGRLTLGDLELNLGSHRAFWKGHGLELSHTQFEIIRHLAERAGTDVHYRELYDLVHGEDFIAGAGNEGYRANVRTFIKRIRQRFKDVDESFDGIENYPGFGYRWRRDENGDVPG